MLCTSVMICNPGPSCWSETGSLNQADKSLSCEQNVLVGVLGVLSTGFAIFVACLVLSWLCLNVTYPSF